VSYCIHGFIISHSRFIHYICLTMYVVPLLWCFSLPVSVTQRMGITMLSVVVFSCSRPSI
jgi:hypothetical protein